MVSLHLIGPDGIQLNRHCERLLITQDFKLHFIAFEFALDYFGHLHSLAFEFDKAIAGNAVIIDRKQNTPLLENPSPRTGLNHASNNYSPTIFRQPEIPPLSRPWQVTMRQAETDSLIELSV